MIGPGRGTFEREIKEKEAETPKRLVCPAIGEVKEERLPESFVLLPEAGSIRGMEAARAEPEDVMTEKNPPKSAGGGGIAPDERGAVVSRERRDRNSASFEGKSMPGV